MTRPQRPTSAWIIGASSGIGAELALQLRDRGDHVAISARSTDRLDALAATDPEHPMTVIPLDATKPDDITRAWEQVRDHIGVPDLVIYSAGLWQQAHPGHFDADQFTRHVEVHLLGLGRVITAVLPVMLSRGQGRIVTIASVAGLRGLSGGEYYAPAKAAQINLGECLRASLAGTGVGVTVVCPGFVDTELVADNTFPMPFLLPPDDAAQRIITGLDRREDEIVFPAPMAALMRTARRLPTPLWTTLSSLPTRISHRTQRE